MRKVLKALLMIVILWIIFYFSSQNATESIASSNSIVDTFTNIFERFKDANIPLINNLLKNVNTVDVYNFLRNNVRRAAHIIEFFVLYIAIYELLKEFDVKKAIILTLIICLGFAIFDELHQMFVIGRTCQFTDVLIDTAGIILASLFWHYIIKR